MHIAHCARTHIVRALRPSRVCVEVGVARGDFAAQILEEAAPRQLYLVDPWWHDDDPEYQVDAANLPQPEMDEAHRFVRARFSSDSRVQVVRCASPDAACQFPSGAMDWVFLDGKHTCKAVVSDLLAWERTMTTQTGLFICHDYLANREAEALHFGVVDAVLWFCKTRGWRIVVRTDEKYSTVVLAQSRRGAARILRGLWSIGVRFRTVDEAEEWAL